MNWTVITGVGAFLCIRLVCHLSMHAILSRTDGERRRARQDRIERVQSEGKSARFLINADKFEIWAERHPYRFFAIQAAGTVLLAMAANWLLIAVDHFQAIQLPPALFVGALVIVAVALGILEHRKSRASDARILALRRDRQPQIEVGE